MKNFIILSMMLPLIGCSASIGTTPASTSTTTYSTTPGVSSTTYTTAVPVSKTTVVKQSY